MKTNTADHERVELYLKITDRFKYENGQRVYGSTVTEKKVTIDRSRPSALPGYDPMSQLICDMNAMLAEPITDTKS